MVNEQASRKIGKTWGVAKETLKGDMMPYLFHEKDVLVTKQAPCMYVVDLRQYTLDTLDEYER